jgi:hypothetical protein
MEDDSARRGAVPPRTEGTDPLYRHGDLPLRAHGYRGGHRVPGLGLCARDRRGVAADKPSHNGALGVRRVRVRHVAGNDVPQAQRSVRGSRACSVHVRWRTAARRGAWVRGRAARRRVPTFACYCLPWFDCDFLPKFE